MRIIRLSLAWGLVPVISLLFSQLCLAEEKQRLLQGYNWYSETIEESKKDDKKNKSEPQSKANNTKDSSAELPEYERNIKKLQQLREQAHRRALDNPTAENILAELYYEKLMIDKASLYANRRAAVASILPQLIDMKAHSNVLHRRISEEQERQEDMKMLRALSKDWGLILQVRDNCPHCHAFAPIVKEFAADNGFQLLAASSHGEQFENIEGVVDKGQMRLFNPEGLTPMLYLLKNDGSEVLPISRGINSVMQIILNIKNIDKHVRRLF